MRLLCGIAALTVVCMLALAVVTDHLADICLTSSALAPSSRVHLIDDVTQALKRAKDDRQKYLSSGNGPDLAAYRAACSEVDSSMDRLVSRDQDVKTKLTDSNGFKNFIHQKLAGIGSVFSRKSAAKPVQAAAPAPTPVAMMDEDLTRIEKMMDSLANEESQDVSGGLDAARARTIFHENLMIAVAVINVLFLAGVGFCVTQIGKLYSLVTVCAWSKRVEYEGKWIPLEEFVRKRFGVRITHGISQEEYDKWATAEMRSAPQDDFEDEKQAPVAAKRPKAA